MNKTFDIDKLTFHYPSVTTSVILLEDAKKIAIQYFQIKFLIMFLD